MLFIWVIRVKIDSSNKRVARVCELLPTPDNNIMNSKYDK